MHMKIQKPTQRLQKRNLANHLLSLRNSIGVAAGHHTNVKIYAKIAASTSVNIICVINCST